MLEGKILVTVGDSITYGADMDEVGVAPDGTRLLNTPEDLEKDPVAAHILRTAGVRKAH